MRNKYFFKDLFSLIPLVFSGLLCITLVFLLWQKTNVNQDFITILKDSSTIFISISGFLSAIIMVYLTASIVGIKNNRLTIVDNLSKVTQKMHNFRSIVEILLDSKM